MARIPRFPTSPPFVFCDDDSCVAHLRKGGQTIVDKLDVELLIQHYWWKFTTRAGGKSYAFFSVNGVCAYLHRLILGAGDGEYVDHRDGDGLNNRRSNLRIATASQNLANRPATRRNTSGFKGVWVRRGAYAAQIVSEGNHRYLGTFASAEDAARAYDIAAREAFGEFAWTNFDEAEKRRYADRQVA